VSAGTGMFQTRMADALLRTLGGRTVLLRMPAPAVQGDVGEQVGLAEPQFQDVALGPVAFRRVRVGTGDTTEPAASELLVSASAVAGIVGSLAFDSAAILFANAAGIVVDGALLRIVSLRSAEAFGSAYLYRLGVRGAATSAV
jgi:hypothetical protein